MWPRSKPAPTASDRDAPARLVSGVEDLDAEGGELLAEGVGAREVLRGAGLGPGVDLGVDRARVEAAELEAAGPRAGGELGAGRLHQAEGSARAVEGLNGPGRQLARRVLGRLAVLE